MVQIPDTITVNGVIISTDLLVDCMQEINIEPAKAYEIIELLLLPSWNQED